MAQPISILSVLQEDKSPTVSVVGKNVKSISDVTNKKVKEDFLVPFTEESRKREKILDVEESKKRPDFGQVITRIGLGSKQFVEDLFSTGQGIMSFAKDINTLTDPFSGPRSKIDSFN